MGSKIIENNTFAPRSDLEIRSNIRRFYNHVTNVNKCEDPIVIDITMDGWISANSLNYILLFIESIKKDHCKAKIIIKLLNNDTVNHVLDMETNDDKRIVDETFLNSNKINRISNKIRFYESINFSKVLFNYDILISPNPIKYQDIVHRLQASPQQRVWKYSSRMLIMSMLIKSEMEQRKLIDKVSTLANILRKNLFMQVTVEEAREDSDQIVYELINNTYQHSMLEEQGSNINRGFTCAQINPKPILNSPPVDSNEIRDLVAYNANRKTRVNFFNLTINDYGIGLAERIRIDLENDVGNNKFPVGRFIIDKEFIKDKFNLILLAATTEFTTKEYTLSNLYKKINSESFLDQKLSNKGFGLISCLCFIAKNYGRMEIVANDTRTLIIAKPKGLFEKENLKNVAIANNIFQKDINSYFVINQTFLEKDESSFPGTQINIEIPVFPY